MDSYTHTVGQTQHLSNWPDLSGLGSVLIHTPTQTQRRGCLDMLLQHMVVYGNTSKPNDGQTLFQESPD